MMSLSVSSLELCHIFPTFLTLSTSLVDSIGLQSKSGKLVESSPVRQEDWGSPRVSALFPVCSRQLYFKGKKALQFPARAFERPQLCSPQGVLIRDCVNVSTTGMCYAVLSPFDSVYGSRVLQHRTHLPGSP